MSRIVSSELALINECIDRFKLRTEIAGICLYGSRAAGYARIDSDYDILVVLEYYPHIIKYLYKKIRGKRISALMVDRQSIEKDAKYSFLGEFVIGRLLHAYEPIVNHDLFERLERTYKKRVIFEQINDLLSSLSLFSTEISFPLEYIMFSKIKNRCSLHPNALYSFFHTYAGKNAKRNIRIALRGYQYALQELIKEGDPPIEVTTHGNVSCLTNSDRVTTSSSRPRIEKKFHELSSYAIHAYAGRKILHYFLREAQSKVNRQRQYSTTMPAFLENPEEHYWNISEGKLIVKGTNWLQSYAVHLGYKNVKIVSTENLGQSRHKTSKFTILNTDTDIEKSIVVKHFIRSTLYKDKILFPWSDLKKERKEHQFFRLGTVYKALRYLRSIGLRTPLIESVVVDKALLITEYIKGTTLKNLTDELLAGINDDALHWLEIAGEEIAKIHTNHSVLRGLRPADLIISDQGIFLTGLDGFSFVSDNPLCDVVHLMTHILGRTSNDGLAKRIAHAFFLGYRRNIHDIDVNSLSIPKKYLESLYLIISSQNRKIILDELRKQ